MTSFTSRRRFAAAILCAAIALCHVVASQVTGDPPRDNTAQTQIAFSHALPRLDGQPS